MLSIKKQFKKSYFKTLLVFLLFIAFSCTLSEPDNNETSIQTRDADSGVVNEQPENAISTDRTLESSYTYYALNDVYDGVYHFYHMDSSNDYLFCYKNTLLDDGNNVHIRRVNNSKLYTPIKKYKISTQWTSIDFVSCHNYSTYALFYKKNKIKNGDYNLVIYLMNSDGTLGERVCRKKIDTGWSQVKLIPVCYYGNYGTSPSFHTYVLCLRDSGYTSDNKNLKIYELTDNDSNLYLIDSRKWSEGWTDVAVANEYIAGDIVNFINFYKRSSDRNNLIVYEFYGTKLEPQILTYTLPEGIDDLICYGNPDTVDTYYLFCVKYGSLLGNTDFAKEYFADTWDYPLEMKFNKDYSYGYGWECSAVTGRDGYKKPHYCKEVILHRPSELYKGKKNFIIHLISQ